MAPLLLALALPLLGGVVLALLGHRERAPEINAAFSFATFLAAAALTIEIIAVGPILVLGKQFFVDPLNVLLVALTAFVAFNTLMLLLAVLDCRTDSRMRFAFHHSWRETWRDFGMMLIRRPASFCAPMIWVQRSSMEASLRSAAGLRVLL